MFHQTLTNHETRRTELNVNPSGPIKQWLASNELKRGVKGEDGSAKLFADNQREIAIMSLANTIRINPNLVDMSRLESQVLGAALVTWIKETEQTTEVVKQVVGNVWPKI